jgi:hypothetical protein
MCLLLFITKATTAPRMITAPRTTRTAMITMLETVDGGGSGKDRYRK